VKLRLLCVSALLGCAAAGDAPDRLRIEVDRSGPWPVIRSLGEAPVRTAHLAATLGGLDAGEGELGSVRSVLVNADGSVYVADPRYRAVLLFDSTGAVLRRLGRDGAGPGEYRTPYSLARLGDTLAVLDPGNARIGLFDSQGQWAGSWILGRVVTGGRHVRFYRTPRIAWAFDIRVTPGGVESILVGYGPEGAGDTLGIPRPDPGLAQNARCDLPDGGMYFHDQPFAAALLIVPTPAGERAVAVTSTYRIAFLSPAGDTARVIERDHEPVPITDADWAEATAGWRAFRAERPGVRCDRDDFPRPAAKPPLGWLFLDDTGRLWVEVTTVAGVVYDVFDLETGGLAFTVRGLPRAGDVDPAVTGRWAAFSLRDSLDVPTVNLYRLSPDDQ
jgi:hypothetical protein